MKKSVVVTGASTGIGQATTKVLVSHGLHVYANVRKEADAARLRDQFGDRVTPLIFDVTDKEAVATAAEQVAIELGENANLLGLVNNAGIAAAGPLMHLPVDQFRHQLEVNLVGILITTQAFLPLLGTNDSRTDAPGRIVNISSVGGKIGAPFLGAYTTSKHGLEGFSETLRRELMLYDIDVIVVGPGPIATPIWDKATEIDTAPFEGTDYEESAIAFRDQMVQDGRNGLAPEEVGKVIYEALTADNPKVRYAVVPNTLLNWTVPKNLPPRILDEIIARSLGWDVRNSNPIARFLASRAPRR